MWWIIGIVSAGMLFYCLSAHAGSTKGDEDVEYLARMLTMHDTLTEPEWAGISWVVLNRIRAGRCSTVRECVTSTSWSANDERRARLAAPAGWTDSRGNPSPLDNPRWTEALEFASAVIAGQVENPIGGRRHFIHPASLRTCTDEGVISGAYICQDGKRYPLWAVSGYAAHEPIMIHRTLFS
jgi:hypothetical protein